LEQRRKTDRTLGLVKASQARLRDSGALSVADLAMLVRQISGRVVHSTPELSRMARSVFSPEQIEALSPGRRKAESQERATRAWAHIVADIDKLPKSTKPQSVRGLAIARRG